LSYAALNRDRERIPRSLLQGIFNKTTVSGCM